MASSIAPGALVNYHNAPTTFPLKDTSENVVETVHSALNVRRGGTSLPNENAPPRETSFYSMCPLFVPTTVHCIGRYGRWIASCSGPLRRWWEDTIIDIIRPGVGWREGANMVREQVKNITSSDRTHATANRKK